MHIYDSVKKEKVEFIPLREKEARIYVCGPTVYDDSHLGHARSALAFDLLRRALKAQGYNVIFMKNFTDIDDKIIKKVNETGKTLEEITTTYTEHYLRDMEAMGVERADIEPKATENLEAMAEMVQVLLEKDIAYKLPNGDIYFDTNKDSEYGCLSHQVNEEESQSRVEAVDELRNPKDFALWKACAGEEDICFDSPLGRGRPGWHTECAAMINKDLALEGEYAIDIHAGGADLLFPHHENEATQMRCAQNRELAKYWMHNGFVNISGEKMSKSLGNSFFIKDALQHYDGEILRFYLISTHYRAPLHFAEEDLLASKKRLDKFYRLKKRLVGVKEGQVDKAFKQNLLDSLADDLNISKALAEVDGMVNHANEFLDQNPKDKGFKQSTVANIAYVSEILGFGGKEPFSYFQLGVNEKNKLKIELLIAQRSAAKKEKDFAKADAIRDELQAMEIAIMDTPQGTMWEKV